MKYLKKFENFSGTDWKTTIETNPYFEKIVNVIENEPEVRNLFNELKSKAENVEIRQVEPLFYDFETASEMLAKELTTYRFESFQNIDTRQLAIQAFKYLAGLGILALLVKLFYKAGRFVFEYLDETGYGAVAGGVLVILLYLVFFGGRIRGTKKSQEVTQNKPTTKDDDGYLDYEEM